MPQFDVYALPTDVLVVDCQADLLSDLDTRLVVPLLAPRLVRAIGRLDPTFTVEGEKLTLFPQGASTVPAKELRQRIASLADDRFTILNSIDLLLTGA